jgi:hypothetical protein
MAPVLKEITLLLEEANQPTGRLEEQAKGCRGTFAYSIPL